MTSSPTPPPAPPIPNTHSSSQPPLPPRASIAEPFVFETFKDELVVSFHDVPSRPNNLPLKVAVKQFVSSLAAGKRVLPRHLFHALGRLRALAATLAAYNAQLPEPSSKTQTSQSATDKYAKYRAMEFFSAFGFQIASPTEPITVDGLDDLIADIETRFHEDIAEAKSLFKQGLVAFDSLHEVYVPGALVASTSSLGGTPVGFRVVHSYYDEHKTLFGMEKSFHLQLEFIVSVGTEFTVIEFEEVLSGWMGARTRLVTELPYFPVDATMLDKLTHTGNKYALFAKGARFLSHKPDTFSLHGGSQRSGMATSGSAQIHGSGRIMVDMARGVLLGHFPSQGFDEPTHALMQTCGRYKRLQADMKGQGKQQTDAMLLFSDLPNAFFPIVWPAITGFSFTTKGWGHVLVDGLEEIRFNDTAFDELVLDADRKQLIRALVRFGGTSFEDIIAGKSGGSIFLLHGPPGVGKTLTAEAIAEVLHRPLYYVTMGELGTSPDEMERRLGDVLTLCAQWDALTLIDEADVFLETRTTSDVFRNAMVCVMLRLLEYHQGILFLTTNRVTEFDPAFESRVTIALRYDNLTPEARAQVWKNLVTRLPKTITVTPLDYTSLSRHVLNGRQIKNSVRLALALAEDGQIPISQELVERTVAITSLGRAQMRDGAFALKEN